MLWLKLMLVMHSPGVDGTVVLAVVCSVALARNRITPFWQAYRPVRHISATYVHTTHLLDFAVFNVLVILIVGVV